MVSVKVNRHGFEVALTRKNLSQRDLAEMIGFSRSHISHIINGRREPSPLRVSSSESISPSSCE